QVGASPVIIIVTREGSQACEYGSNVVNISWKIYTSVVLQAANPVELCWTMDHGASLNDINLGVINGSNSGCSFSGEETGCYSFIVPLALVGYAFKIVLKATDVNGASSNNMSGLLNVTGRKLLAGKMVKMLDGAALSTDLSIDV